jgi:hypothetical protein
MVRDNFRDSSNKDIHCRPGGVGRGGGGGVITLIKGSQTFLHRNPFKIF